MDNNTRKTPSTKEQLHRFVTTRNIVNILTLLERNDVDIEGTDPTGNTIVHLVFRNCDSDDITQHRIIEILKIFLDRGVDPNSKNNGGFTALHLAVVRRMKRVVEFLLNRKVNINVRDAHGNTLIHYFVKCEFERLGRFEVETSNAQIVKLKGTNFLDWLAKNGFELDRANNSGRTPLHLAVQYNLQHMVLALLHHIPSMDLTVKTNRMLLHRFLEAHTKMKKPCMKFGDFSLFSYYTPYTADVVEKMLTKGVSVDVVNERNETVLHVAIKHKVSVDILELLVEKFTAVNATDDDGKTTLDLAMDVWWKDSDIDGYVRILRSLITKDAIISQQSPSGLTPVQQAVVKNNLELLCLLKQHGADLQVRTPKGENLLHLAVADERTIEYLVLNGVDINSRDNEGNSPLHSVVWQRCTAKVKSLLRFGANVDLPDDMGLSVLRKAICQRNLDMVKELLKYGVDMRDYEILEHFATIDRDVRDCLLTHIVKMSAARVPGVEECERAVGSEIFNPFRKECQREIETLKMFFVDDRTSLLDFLRMDSNRRCAYVKNAKLEAILNDPIFANRFPNYFVLLLGSYLQSIRRKFMLRPAERAWYKLTGIYLPHVCVDRILAHMSNVDLMMMIRRDERGSKRKTTEVVEQRKKRRRITTVYFF